MRKKSFTLGLGLGIILMAVLSYLFYGVQNQQHERQFEEKFQASLNVERIIELAGEMGLELVSDAESASMSDVEAELSDADIVERAKELGMVFAENRSADAGNADSSDNAVNDNSFADDDDAVNTSSKHGIYVTIAPGMRADEVVNLLLQSGVINETTEFSRLLSVRNATRILRSGDFYFKSGLSYEEILNILLR